MRLLSILLLTTALVAPTSACNKGSEPGTMSPPAPGLSDGSTSSAASGQGVETSSAPANGRATLGEGFEGALVMHTTSASGATDMLFITKGGKLRADTPQQGGRTAHTIFDPAAGKLTLGGFFTYTMFLGYLAAPLFQVVGIGTQITSKLESVKNAL